MSEQVVERVPLRRVLTRIEQGWSPQCEGRLAEPDEWGVLKVGCVNGGRFDELEHKALPSDLAPIPELEVRSGDLLMSRANTRELVGSVAVIQQTRPRLMLCDKLFRIIIAPHRAEPRFIAYSITSDESRRSLEADATGASSSMLNIGQDSVRRILIWLPTLQYQIKLTQFLDRKISSIDALIAKKERLIALLQEQRQALIHHAVTSGQPIRLDHVLQEIQRPVNVIPDQPYVEIGVRSHGRGIFHKEVRFGWQLEEKKVFWIEPGDLIFNIVFAWERAVAVASASESGLIGSHRFPTFRPLKDCADVRYLKYLFISDFGRFLLDQNSPGAAGRNRTLDRRALLKEKVQLPEIGRQREIAEMLDQKCHAIDQTTASMLVSVQKLREYRQALITAAVTGKIDVTKEDAPDAG